MYYCLCENHKYSYEIYEILSMYFTGEKLTVCDSKSSVPENCLLLESIVEVNGSVNAKCSLIEVKSGAFYKLGSASSSLPIEDDCKRSIKHGVKNSVFKLLRDITKIEMPWGVLVGIRPSKIVNDLKSKNKSDNEITHILKNSFFLRDDKIELVKRISDYSYNIINRDNKTISIYIGIPFCPTRCIYCSFASYPIDKYTDCVENYVMALKYEITRISEFINKHFNIETIYIGGGTPTSLPDELFNSLLVHINEKFDVKAVKEFTVEAGRPDTIDKIKLQIMKASYVSRISINPQTMNEDTLIKIGRNHSVQDIVNKFMLAREEGFYNINMDMILGLPDETIKQVSNTLYEITKLSPENITVHTLAIKRASKLKEDMIENVKIPIPEGPAVNSMMEYVQNFLNSKMYNPYYMYRQKMMVGNLENVGYCKSGFEGIYNIQMIEEKETVVGLGADAVSKLVFLHENRIERFPNKKDIKEYINTIEENTEKKIQMLSMLT